MFVDNKEVPYKEKYKFNKTGIHIIKFKINKDIIKFSLECMFNECKNIESINFKVFNTSNIKYMNSMFSNCINLKV